VIHSVVFHVATAVYKFDFRLVVSEIRNKWRPELVKYTTSCIMTDVYLIKHVTNGKVGG